MTTTQLNSKLDLLPEYLKQEAADFIDFLVSKSKQTTQQFKPQFGSAKGFYEMTDDFDEPLEDFKEYLQ